MKVKCIDNRSIFIPCNMVADFIRTQSEISSPFCKIDGEEYYVGSVVHYTDGIQIEFTSKNVVEIVIEEI